jgi:hypothetical protein
MTEDATPRYTYPALSYCKSFASAHIHVIRASDALDNGKAEHEEYGDNFDNLWEVSHQAVQRTTRKIRLSSSVTTK